MGILKRDKKEYNELFALNKANYNCILSDKLHMRFYISKRVLTFFKLLLLFIYTD